MKKTFIAIIAAILFFVPAATILAPRGSVSKFENRALAAAPVLTRESFFDGKFFASCDEYYKDHVFMRDGFLAANAFSDMYILRRPVVNGITSAGEFLFPYSTYVEPLDKIPARAEQAADDVSRLNDAVSEYGGKFLYVGIPNQQSLFHEKYREYLDIKQEVCEETAKSFFDALEKRGISHINMGDIFSKCDLPSEDFYMKSDHHYNLRGAYETYRTICGFCGVLPVDSDFSELPNPFYGSRGRQLYNLSPISDRLMIPKNCPDIPHTRADNGNIVQTPAVVLPNDESEAVAYTNYMGGDVAETVIKTSRPELPSILLYGDSFTNGAEVFLYRSFDETRSLDLRHYSEMGIIEYVKKYRPDFVVCIRDDLQYLTRDGNGNIK